ncbi:hypothetical protein [Frankia sp. CiP3]|uniref:hypothetical protein n=1 Tax=Frankia sp. CiP3 TaxID=2880971 RepID=UPI001EF4E88E|nr:hypothetical protein [Frankia sp. CiP3]
MTVLAGVFDGTRPPPTARAADRAAQAYRDALLQLLDNASPAALCLLFTYDSAIHPADHQRAFERVEPRFTAVVANGDLAALTVALLTARRLGWRTLHTSASQRLAVVLGRQADAGIVATHLSGWQAARLLDVTFLTEVLQTYVTHTQLGQDPAVWSPFLASLPPDHLPPLFEVQHYLGRGADAARLASTADQRRLAVDCCLRSSEIADVEAGLELAECIHPPAVGALRYRAADLLFAADRYEQAAAHYRAVGRLLEASVCFERLGRFREAMEFCPAEAPARAALLAAHCLPEIDLIADRQDFAAAVRYAHFLLGHLDRMAEDDETAPVLGQRRGEVERRRQAALTAGRRLFGAKVREATAGDSSETAKSIYAAWSRFEEEAGELADAGRLAEAADDHYRAHRLYSEAGQFGQAERVMRGDDSPGALAARAVSLEAGGDLLAAARLREEAGRRRKPSPCMSGLALRRRRPGAFCGYAGTKLSKTRDWPPSSGRPTMSSSWSGSASGPARRARVPRGPPQSCACCAPRAKCHRPGTPR